MFYLCDIKLVGGQTSQAGIMLTKTIRPLVDSASTLVVSPFYIFCLSVLYKQGHTSVINGVLTSGHYAHFCATVMLITVGTLNRELLLSRLL